MIALAHFLHYGTIASVVGITAIGVGIGQGLTSKTALEAINKQPAAKGDITRAVILGMALIETAAIMGIFMSILLIIGSGGKTVPLYQGLASLGIIFAICIPGITLGIVSSWPAQAASMAIARQPLFAQQIIRFMLITLSLIQTPIIFGLIIAFFIRTQAVDAHTIRDALRLISSGICIGVGAIGPSIGLALFTQNACKSLGYNRKAYGKILSFTLISEAIIETPIIFSLVISVCLLFLVPIHTDENILDGIGLLAAGICTAIGTFGPGISSGKTASAACREIAKNPSLHSVLSRLSMFAQGLIETCAIYTVLTSIFLVFFR